MAMESNAVLGLSVLSFCAWAVSLAGIAALQDECKPNWELEGINGFSAGLPCYRLFRYYWWIISFQFVTVVAIIIACVGGFYAKYRQSLLGLLVIVTMLYIQTSDSFYTLTHSAERTGGELKDRARTMAAGSIMVAAINCVLVVAMGIKPCKAAAPALEGKASAV